LLESELFGHTRGSFTGAFRDRLGLVQQADHGTLFLDELGEMSLRMQAMLLRFTETAEFHRVGADGPVSRADVRLITATNRDLPARIAEGAFREDLYYRLNVILLQMPPLRERRGDIMLLAQHYLERAAAAHGLPVPILSAEAVQLLRAYRWPGNVRELRNVAERLVLFDKSRPVAPEDLPSELRGSVEGTSRAGSGPEAPSGRDWTPGTAAPAPNASVVADQLWGRMHAGEDFWSVVGRGFKARELTRADLIAVVDRGLTDTRGSYRALLSLLNLPSTDYKRFHAFLHQHQCNLPVAPYRQLVHEGRRPGIHRR